MAHEDHLGKVWPRVLETCRFFFPWVLLEAARPARKRERPWLRAEDVLCAYSQKLKKLRKK